MSFSLLIFKEIVDEVDVGGLLGGGGVVIEEGRDADVDVVDAFDLVGEFEGLGEGRFKLPHILPSLSEREVRMGLEAFTSAGL